MIVASTNEQVSWLRFWRIEKWMWHVFKRKDGKVVGAGCLELEVQAVLDGR